MKRLIACLLAAALVMALGACASPKAPDTTESTPADTESRSRADMLVGISLPDETDPRWAADGEALRQRLEELGYRVRLVYAGGDALRQAQQLLELTQAKVDCMVIAAVDSAVLTQAEQTAAEAGIHMIAYDRLLMDTAHVNYYVSFDNKAMGRAIAEYIVRTKKLNTAAGESYTIEFFMGSPEDNNALLLYQGVMEVLQPYLESGVLVCLTGRTAFEDTCIVDWQEQTARENCAAYLGEYYTQQSLDICCTVSDSFAAGCIAALETAGYTLGAQWPLVTGQDASAQEQLTSGKQAMTVRKDTALLVEQCTAMVDALLAGETPRVNDTESCHNNVLTVPAYLCGFEVIEGTYPPEAPQTEPTQTADTAPTQ